VPAAPNTTDHRANVADAYEGPRPDVQALVPRGVKRILDLGCSSGALGAELKRTHGAEVVGIEIDADYAADAATRLDRAINADLEQFFGDPDSVAGLGRFDCLIAADVLEHLVDPWSVLARAAALLEPGGVAVVSLPNVRFWETFWQLGWKGEWPRREMGIYDRTHLRFFTAGDACGMLEQAGLQWTEITRIYRFSSTWETPRDRYAKLFAKTPLRPFFVFQHVILARKL
jgi:2-polyprenyl-3-methyl-5-hydroxy-6-metoxy-1,4-benzoquinol methylase